MFLSVIALLFFANIENIQASEMCVTTVFKTKLYKDACTKGGQKAAKDAAKVFLKNAAKSQGKSFSCNNCHTKLSPNYPLKPDALSNFQKWGGK